MGQLVHRAGLFPTTGWLWTSLKGHTEGLEVPHLNSIWLPNLFREVSGSLSGSLSFNDEVCLICSFKLRLFCDISRTVCSEL